MSRELIKRQRCLGKLLKGEWRAGQSGSVFARIPRLLHSVRPSLMDTNTMRRRSLDKLCTIAIASAGLIQSTCERYKQH
jgi:hypothetical protein